VVIDTNVVLDVLLDRRPHSIASSLVMSFADSGRIEGLLGATTLTTVYYLARKVIGSDQARIQIRKLLGTSIIAPVDKVVLLDAASLDFADFEDAVLHEAGRHAGATGIVTRDRKGFANGALRVYNPEELLRAVRSDGRDSP
jgi:predicted nucleic acid-binding protein